MAKHPESPHQINLFDADAKGKPLADESQVPPPAEAPEHPTEQDEREATALLDGAGATLVTPTDRARQRAERQQAIDEGRRRLGLPTDAPLLDVERRRREQERRKRPSTPTHGVRG